MIDSDKCEIPNCANEATRITTSQTRYINICDECWHDKYKS